MNHTGKEITLIIIGSLFFALGVNWFAIPNELGEGGVTGISMIFYYLLGWSPGISNFIMNSILLAIGYKVLNKRVTWYTMIAIFSTSLFIHLTEGMGHPVDIMLGTVFSGVFIGDWAWACLTFRRYNRRLHHYCPDAKSAFWLGC